MAYTSHGHQIQGTPVEEPKPTEVARCGGPRMCQKCSMEANLPVTTEERLTHNEFTLFKVYSALAKVGISSQTARDAINEMQNAGILFRERG